MDASDARELAESFSEALNLLAALGFRQGIDAVRTQTDWTESSLRSLSRWRTALSSTNVSTPKSVDRALCCERIDEVAALLRSIDPARIEELATAARAALAAFGLHVTAEELEAQLAKDR